MAYVNIVKGASGAGKSTLLDVLAQRKTTGTISGQILYNYSPALTSSAYVMQDNVHIASLTVKESLWYAAQLRLPEQWSTVEKEERVQHILQVLGLTAVANTIVGNEYKRGISGGQAKRLSIGVEIINLPDLMFLDEPTTGLDSTISLEVMAAVRNLANQNRTVICTIHSPSPPTFALFDSLLLLAKGRTIYFGPVDEAVPYFTQSPFEFHFKPNSNPADFVVAVAGSFLQGKGDRHVSGDELADYYSSSKGIENEQRIREMSSLKMNGKEDVGVELERVRHHSCSTSIYHQIKTLTQRAVIKTLRDRRATVVTFAR